ncbi:cupin domain-containing protein [Nostoc sphaeroides CHAB 2801]|uniref:cupin domain-containing protein n=1 Tax=Nostoc sphaeroides TaxID=446679 RepID=UPI001E515005|nr:cupin domain-containing protein [Nostoc sphaeroides]MCC5633256.1 cupin domain-containing protein [Nostoc sphaeroides CHAB 2801]
MKKFSIIIAGAALSALCFGLETAQAHPGHSPFTPHEITPLSKAGGQDVLVVPPDATGRPAYYSTGNIYTFLATGQETGGAFSIFDFFVPPQSATLPHIHSQEDEVFYVREGEVTFQLGSPTGIQNISATPGTFIFLPKNRPHTWQNTGTTPAKMLTLVFPAGFEQFFVDQNQPVIDPSAPIPPPLPPELLAPIGQRYRVRPASPSDFSENNLEGLLDYLVVQPNSNRPSFNEAGALFTSLATSEETGGQLSLFNVALAPQTGSAQIVSNEQESQSFYILDGDVTFQLGNKTTVGKAGTFIYLPKGTSYTFQNLGTTPARTLLLRTPTSVPEPTSTLGLLALGALGTTFLLKHKKTDKTHNVCTQQQV